jgi:thiol-disulfide isomerase/thioredoxin
MVVSVTVLPGVDVEVHAGDIATLAPVRRLLIILILALAAAACGGAADPTDETVAEADAPAPADDAAGADGDGTADDTAQADGAGGEADAAGGEADAAGGEADAAGGEAGSEPLVPFATVPTVDGGEIDGATLAGRDIALWFWAPWCPTCNREAPTVASAAEALDDDVDIIGVASRDDVSAMQAFVDEHGLDDIVHLADGEGQVWQRFGVVAQPAWVFIDGETGRAERVLGTIPEATLVERLEALAG